ncbi:MAG: 2-dehydro-3-deoxy-6-phosphogalactonate aldolase [Opitutus sp.]|nr:2-dehydro-3-deoxy-6-phosphogalactonate aldolase [Opitutus sp.]
MSVRIQGLPTGLSPAVNRVVLAHLQDKSAHSDIATELAAAVKPLGGKVRPAASLSAMVRGEEDAASLTDQTHQLLTQGYRHVQVQPAATSVKAIVAALESLREKFGPGVELLHRALAPLPADEAVDLARALEPFRLFYLENAVAPHDAYSLENLRRQTSTPLALGETCVEPHEWLPLVTNRWIDFLRLRVPAVGGLSMARKIAAACEFSRVRTAWSNPVHVSPVGQAVNLHLNLATPNFGIQETVAFPAAARAVFPGAPEIRGGCLYASDRPGIGLDVDERAAVLA